MLRRIDSRTLGLALGLAACSIAGAQGNTQFIQQAKTYTEPGAYTSWTFTAHTQTTFVIRFAADYAGGALIMTPTQFNRFKNYQSFNYWGYFRQFGTKWVTIPSGNYVFVVSNESSGANSTAAELDFRLAVQGWKRNNIGLNWSTYVPARGWAYERFSKQAGYRTFIDGCNSGLQTFLIPAGQIGNFTSGAAFNYYAGYSGSSRLLPGFYEIELANGNYAMAYKNPTGKRRAITHQSEIFVPAGTASFRSVAQEASVTAPSRPVSTEANIDSSETEPGFSLPSILDVFTPQASSSEEQVDPRARERMDPEVSTDIQSEPSQAPARTALHERP